MYKFLKYLLFKCDPELAHCFGIKTIKGLGTTGVLSALSSLRYESNSLTTNYFNLKFDNPVGLAAGFDKDCHIFQYLSFLGFGFGEVGTITPLPQSGNLKPRLYRDPENQALLNHMGFNNDGIEQCLKRLKKHTSRRTPLFINIGKNKDTPIDQSQKDYQECLKILYDHGDAFVLNISSPNTPHLRSLHSESRLLPFLNNIQTLNHSLGNKPLLIKISPDLTLSELDEVIHAIIDSKIDGVIATNTSTDKKRLSHQLQKHEGGVSGKPLKEKSLTTLKHLRKSLPKNFFIIRSGGIFSGNDIFESIAHGANLVEIYTAWIYEGPFLIHKILMDLDTILKNNHYTTLNQAISCKL